jgi:hypothetical protein
MKTTKILILTLVLIIISLSGLQAQTVYVTDNGKKYHAKNCSLVKTGKKGLEMKEAIRQGYTACNICKPDELHEGKKKKATLK